MTLEGNCLKCPFYEVQSKDQKSCVLKDCELDEKITVDAECEKCQKFY